LVSLKRLLARKEIRKKLIFQDVEISLKERPESRDSFTVQIPFLEITNRFQIENMRKKLGKETDSRNGLDLVDVKCEQTRIFAEQILAFSRLGSSEEESKVSGSGMKVPRIDGSRVLTLNSLNISITALLFPAAYAALAKKGAKVDDETVTSVNAFSLIIQLRRRDILLLNLINVANLSHDDGQD
jgi:hypothetical protein